MATGRDEALSPTPRYYQVLGRAAEIARALGSPIGGPEHLFLAILHDGGWPLTTISPMVDLGHAEEAVLRLVTEPGYSPPPAPRFPAHSGFVQPWGGDVAAEMGDSHVGVEHALLAMIRSRETIPARALAGLADLDAVEAAVVEAKNAPRGPSPDAAYLPEGQRLDGALCAAIIGALPEGTTFGFNHDADQRAWVCVLGPAGSELAVTRRVLNTALASLKRPTLDG